MLETIPKEQRDYRASFALVYALEYYVIIGDDGKEISDEECSRTLFPTDTHASWADDHVVITGIIGIGKEKTYSLCGELGSRFVIDEWEYHDIGVAIWDRPSAGHDMIFLDYRECGSQGDLILIFG